MSSLAKPVLVTGGAGFVGSTLCIALKRDQADHVRHSRFH